MTTNDYRQHQSTRMTRHHSVRGPWFSSITIMQAVVIAFIAKLWSWNVDILPFCKVFHCTTVKEISGRSYDSLVSTYFWCAYHMSFKSFNHLHFIILPHIIVAMDGWRTDNEKVSERTGRNYLLPPVPNGPISHNVCLACAIWCFAGGGSVVSICCSCMCVDNCVSY